MMTVLFFLLALVLTLLAGAVLVRAMSASVAPAVDRARINVAIFRERRAELDAERDAGRMDAQQHAALVAELERMLVDDVADAPVAGNAAPPASQPVPRWRLVALWLSIPLLALAVYLGAGFPPDTRAWLQLQGRMADVAALPQPLSSESVATQGITLLDAARLTQATLQRRPADADAWYRLGLTWLELQAPGPAVECLRTARRLAPMRSDITITLARVELVLNRNQLNDDIRALFDAVLAQEPNHQGVLMVYGMAAFDSGDFAAAAARWEQLLAQIDAKSEGAGLLRQSIARARANEKAALEKPAAEAAAVPVRVVLGSGIENPPATATLFVVIRAAGGPPMPVAARKLAPQLPVDVTLTDADQMMPGASLAARGPLEVRARISLSGNPMPAAGDVESAPVRITLPLDAPVTLTLEHRIP